MKKIIFPIIILIILLTLLIVYIDRKYTYPVYYDLRSLSADYYDLYRSSSKFNSVLNRLVENKTNDRKLIFWETSVRFGMTKTELIKLRPSLSEINYNGKTIDADIVYDCIYEGDDSQLNKINIRTPYDPSVENEWMAYYGQKHIRSPKWDGNHKKYFYVWVVEDGFAVMEKSLSSDGKEYLYLEIGTLYNHWGEEVNWGAYNNTFEDKSIYNENVLDSLNTLIEQIELRKKQEYNSSIFAGLYFGDSPEDVEWVLEDDECRKILVPNGDNVGVVNIATYDAEYYEEGLASLVLYAEENELIDGLETVYSTKYGKTKNRKWHFANCSIEINYGGREVHDPAMEAGYGRSSGPTLYYDSFKGYRGDRITKDGTFLKIEYKNHDLLRLIKREEEIADSLDNIRKLEAIEAEHELARILATETATGI